MSLSCSPYYHLDSGSDAYCTVINLIKIPIPLSAKIQYKNKGPPTLSSDLHCKHLTETGRIRKERKLQSQEN